MIHWQSVKFPAVGLDVQPPWHGERYLGMVFLTFTFFRPKKGDYMTESDPQTGSKEMAGQSQAARQSDFTVVMVALVVIPA